MSDRDYGINILRLWWNVTPMAPLGFTKFSDAIAHYDQVNPDFIASFGRACRPLNVDRVRKALEVLASDSGSAFPKYPQFLEYVSRYVGGISFSDARQIVSESADQVGKVALLGGGIYLIGVAALALAFLWNSKRTVARAK